MPLFDTGNVGKLDSRFGKYIPRSLWSIANLLFDSRSFLYSSGYLKSLLTIEPRRQDNSPLPWFTYSAISFLEERLRPSFELFEYGSGLSTLYFQGRVKKVTSVEHSREWVEIVRQRVDPDKVMLLHRSIEGGSRAYTDAILEHDKKYDLAIVDGKERVQCFSRAFDALADDGIIIFDDADRPRYQEIFAIASSRNFASLRFRGLRPASCLVNSTVIFYRRNQNNLDI